ncbi:hypothetical protein MBOT_03820 [Mycobacterium botniense]|uniref:Uncharacterized protein n=1 Tax=Mycobacterium botniense TaxID=84962 RepID=A0A7I9XUN7_9MYCO|nr:hypothetical protein MBOT_03820 [Mycobacterium botniense]
MAFQALVCTLAVSVSTPSRSNRHACTVSGKPSIWTPFRAFGRYHLICRRRRHVHADIETVRSTAPIPPRMHVLYIRCGSLNERLHQAAGAVAAQLTCDAGTGGTGRH